MTKKSKSTKKTSAAKADVKADVKARAKGDVKADAEADAPQPQPPPERHEDASPERDEPPSWRWPLIAIAVLVVGLGAYRFLSTPSPESSDETPLAVEPGSRGSHRDGGADVPAESAERLRVRVLRAYPHAPDAFTQGLLWHEGQLYESTGLRGRSSVRRVDMETGVVLERREVERPIFAEGLARVGEELFQLSWTSGILQVWSVQGFEPLRRMDYEGEGWGLCYDGQQLVMSDGSDRLTFRNPQTFEIERSVRVHAGVESIDELNELECVNGAVWANIWMTDRIVRIDPQSGEVTAFVDASGLLDPDEALDADVLNGIAWIPEREHFVITGKLWPRLYEVEFVSE